MGTYNLKIGSWNVHGIGSKFECTDFVNRITEFDICFLSETWRNECTQLPDYYVYSKKTEKKVNKKGRKAGGMAIIIKNKLRKGTKIIKDTKYGVWIKLNQSFFKTERDIYLCACYIPHSSSPYSIDKPFEMIEKDIIEFPDSANFMIMGDFNSRTGCLKDQIKECKLEAGVLREMEIQNSLLLFRDANIYVVKQFGFASV